MVKARLSEEGRARIRAAVERAEAASAAQLVVVVADECGSYAVFGVLWAALAALVAGALAVLAAPWLSATELLLVEGGLFVAIAAALASKPLLLPLVPGSVRRAHARQVAEHQFAARVGGRTPSGTGMLLFVALAEHQVLILPDAGIAAAVEMRRWEEIVARLSASARAGRLEDAIVEAVDAAGAVLAPAFPPETPPQNPLADEVVELDRSNRPLGPR